MYQEVLSLSNAKADNSVDWAKVFEDQSLYRQIYKQEIIMAVMEDTDDDGSDKRVIFVEDMAKAATYSAQRTSGFGDDFEEEKDALNDIDQEKLRAKQLKNNWTKQFLENQGWNYILSSFLGK